MLLRRLCPVVAVLFLATAGLLVVDAGPVSAHARLAFSDPAEGQVVTEPVGAVTFGFTQAVEPFADGFDLVSFDGTSVDIAGVRQLDDTTIVIETVEPIVQPVAATWPILSADSHPRTGSVVLTIGDPDQWVARACRLAARELTATEWVDLVPGDEPRRPICS